MIRQSAGPYRGRPAAFRLTIGEGVTAIKQTRWRIVPLCTAVLFGLTACGSGGSGSTAPTAGTHGTGATQTALYASTTAAEEAPSAGTISDATATAGTKAIVPNHSGTPRPTTRGQAVTAKTTKKGQTAAPTTPHQKEKVSVNKTLAPLPAEDSRLLNKNPDRGFRLEINMDVHWIASNRTYEGMKEEAGELIDDGNRSGEDITLAQSYMYLYGFHQEELTAKALQAIEAYLDALHDRGMKAVLRYAYSRDMPDPANDAKQDIILRHIQQLRPLMAKRKDYIHVYQAGFVGAWGEWHSEAFPLDRKLILRNILEVLVPDGMYVQMRLPDYKNLLPSNHPGYKRIGIHNDSIFGKTVMSQYGTGGLDAGTDQWQQVVEQGPYTPQDGELYVSGWNVTNNIYCDGYAAIQQFSEHRFTSLSVSHGYADIACDPSSAMGRWKKQALTEDWLKANHIVYSPNWFRDKNGRTVARNVFEFVRDHLGYRIEAQNVDVTGESKPGATIQVSMPLINYGFSAAFNMSSGFAILDKDNKVVSTVKAGNPEQWYNRSPTNYADDKVLTHTVGASMKLPAKSGHYKLAFYLRNNLGDCARVGNQLDYVGGYNVLHEFDL